MGRLHVNTGAIRSTAKDIRSANERIRDGFDSTTKSVFNPLMNSWESPAASHAVKRFTDIRNCFYSDRYTVMDNYARFLEQLIGEGYDETEKNNTSLADLFK